LPVSACRCSCLGSRDDKRKNGPRSISFLAADGDGEPIRPNAKIRFRMDPQARIRKVIESVTKKPVTLAADESLFDSGVLDSFALADAVTGLESEFGIKVPDADLNPRKFDSIARIDEYIAQRLV
jgi:acyl carrier protein